MKAEYIWIYVCYVVMMMTVYCSVNVSGKVSVKKVKEGQSINLSCMLPDPSRWPPLTWRRNGVRIGSVTSSCKVLKVKRKDLYTFFCPNGYTSVLTIRQVTRKDNGQRWSCGPLYGKPAKEYQLNVIVSEKVSVEKFAIEGQDIKLSCRHMNSRQQAVRTLVTWRRNGVQIGVITASCKVSIFQRKDLYKLSCPNGSTLTIRQVTRKDNGQKWSCKPQYGEPTMEYQLNVIVYPGIPVISNTTTATNGELIRRGHINRPMTIECISKDGYPKQKIEWYKTSRNMDEPLKLNVSMVYDKDRYGVYTVIMQHTFTPTLHDNVNGTQFICQTVGGDPGLSFNLERLRTAVILLMPPVPPEAPTIYSTSLVESGEQLIWSELGQNITLECVSRGGYPQQTVQWYKENTRKPLTSDVSVREEDGLLTVWNRYTLTPTLADDGAKYVCQSSFKTGPGTIKTSDADVALRIVAQPMIPSVSNTSLTKYGEHLLWHVLGNTDQELGENMTLECVSRGGYPQQTVQWFKENVKSTPLTSDVSVREEDGLLTVWNRYTLTPTLADDGAKYVCQSSFNTTQGVIESSSTEMELRVVLPPKKPEISSTAENDGAIVRTENRRSITLACTSRNGYPQQAVNWFYRYYDSVASIPLVESRKDVVKVDGLFTVTSYYTFTATHREDDRMYICQSIIPTGVGLSETSQSNVTLHLEASRVEEDNDDMLLALIGGSFGGGAAIVLNLLILVVVFRRFRKAAVKPKSDDGEKSVVLPNDGYIQPIDDNYDFILEDRNTIQ